MKIYTSGRNDGNCSHWKYSSRSEIGNIETDKTGGVKMILIKNGRVVDAKSNTDGILDVVLEGGKIKTMTLE